MGGRFGSIQARSVKRTHKWVCHVVPDEPFDSSQVGLPDDYDRRGCGFAGMRADADAVGGSLKVDTDDQRGGTTVSCTVPL